MFNSVVGLILVCFLSVIGVVEYDGTHNECFVFSSETLIIRNKRTSFQLGGFIVTDKDSLEHEYGHYLQEKILGIYYLPLVGLTSAYGNTIKPASKHYHDLWSEAWANELGRR